MKTIRVLVLLLFVLFWAVPAWAQYTLYGSPEVLRLPQPQATAWAPASYPTYPTAQPGPVYAPAAGSYGAAYAPTAQPGFVPSAGVGVPLESVAPPQERPSVVSSMLAESGGGPCAEGTCQPERTCESVPCETVCVNPWFATAGWITMGRDKGNRFWTSYQTGREDLQLTNTGDINMDWGNGGEIRFGRRFCGCSCECPVWGLEAVYWTMQPVHGYLATTNPATVSTPMEMGFIRFAGASAVPYFDQSVEHRLWRRNEFHNVELNILRGSLCGPCQSSWNVQWVLGVRFFRFDEDLRFGSAESGFTWSDTPDHQAYLDERIKNNLVGVQFGFDARSNCWNKLQLYVSPKVGIYNNYIENRFSIYRGDGVNAYAVDQFGSLYGTYPVSASDNVLSVLTELDMGLYWHVTQNWSAKVGYRLVAATNMGLADHQFLHFVNDIPEIGHVKTNGDLLLHGAYAGITYNY